MYFSSMLTVGKADNGFVIECCVPIKRKESKNSKGDICCPSMNEEKRFIAKTAKEAGEYITSMLPLLDTEYDSTKAFDAAFSECMGDEDGDD